MNNHQSFITLAYLTNKLASSENYPILDKLNTIKPLIENKNDLITALLIEDNITVGNFYKVRKIVNDTIFVEEELILKDFISSLHEEINEEIANVSGPMVSTDTPKISTSDVNKYKNRYPSFEVNDNLFNKLSGKSSRSILGGMNLESYEEKMLYNFSKNNPSKQFVLKNNNKVKIVN